MIGGNLEATFQAKSTIKNEIGEGINNWTNIISIKGYLDLSSGTSNNSHKTKSVESTYMFLSNYNETVRNLDPAKCRCLINNRIYEVNFIDDPMELHDHLEITLKMVGVLNVG